MNEIGIVMQVGRVVGDANYDDVQALFAQLKAVGAQLHITAGDPSRIKVALCGTKSTDGQSAAVEIGLLQDEPSLFEAAPFCLGCLKALAMGEGGGER